MKTALRISLCLFTVGCIHTSVRQLDQTPRPARTVDAVAVLSEVPDRPFTVVATVRTSSATVFDSFDALRRRLVAQAAALGGDAVIVGPESSTATPIFNTVGFVMSEQKAMQGDVIVFRPH